MKDVVLVVRRTNTLADGAACVVVSRRSSADSGSAVVPFACAAGSNQFPTAYDFNRADPSYIPGTVGSGTAFMRPDFPEPPPALFPGGQAEWLCGDVITDYTYWPWQPIIRYLKNKES